jgi:hypothetical protein
MYSFKARIKHLLGSDCKCQSKNCYKQFAAVDVIQFLDKFETSKKSDQDDPMMQTGITDCFC